MVAALFVLLACPSTDAIAGAPDVATPTIGSNPNTGGPPVGVDENDDDASGGDADGLSGFTSKSKLDLDGGSATSFAYEGQWVALKLWWNLLIWYR
jgi:hypothetical protein